MTKQRKLAAALLLLVIRLLNGCAAVAVGAGVGLELLNLKPRTSKRCTQNLF